MTNQLRPTKTRLASIRQSLRFESVFVLLVLVSLGALIGEFFFEVSPETARRLGRINTGIAWIFLADFFFGLYLAVDNKRYFKTDWYLLLASIPIDEYVFGSLRVFRLIRVFRIYGIASRPLAISTVRQKVAPRDKPNR